MPINSVTIQFGGLCMYVQRPEGLFVLLPDMSTPAHHQEPHCAVMMVEPQYAGTPVAMMFPLRGKAIDLRSIGVGTGSPSPVPWGLAVSEYTGNTPVEDTFISAPPKDCLATRISLPLGLEIQHRGDEGLMDIENGPTGVLVYGRGEVNMPLANPNVNTLTISDTVSGSPIATLRPANDQIKIFVINIPLCDLNEHKPRKSHSIGDRSDHPDAFYWLLQGFCPSHKTGPKFFIAKQVGGSGKVCAPKHCPTAAHQEAFDPPVEGVNWVDTHDCTQATGI